MTFAERRNEIYRVNITKWRRCDTDSEIKALTGQSLKTEKLRIPYRRWVTDVGG